MYGIYSALAAMFKLGHRAELLPQLPLLGALTSSPASLLEDSSVTRRKLGMKLLQRVASVHLPPRVAAWRYQRGCRSLETNLQLTSSGAAAAEAAEAAPAEEEGEEEEEEEEVPEAIEEILEQLLRGLRDADTVVRWSAAKGIGRVTARLPLDLADDIVESVLELLTSAEEANAWHGGCLALAELARRGLLLPKRLGEVLPRLETALHYDVPRGATSVGTHVRDAACYVCWAFARAFEPSVMAPYVEPLGRALLIVVVFDREVNCRRAASAALQENVGRQGSFPHGIDIVTRADYFTVGSRPNAYLDIGRYIGTFDAYRRPMLDHLSNVKSKHWDVPIRLLAAQAAARLAPLDSPYILETVLPMLFTKTLSPDLKARHGSTHMIAEILLGLVGELHAGQGRELPAEIRKAISGLVPAIEKARLYKGRGGEIMRGATCRLLEVQAILHMPAGPKTALKTLASIDDSVKHPHEPISLAAVAALRAVSSAYFASAPADGSSPLEPLVARYAKPLATDPNAALRRGYTLALGSLPAAQLRLALPQAVRALVVASRMEDNVELRDPETRRNAVRALLQVASTAGLAAFAPPPPPAVTGTGAEPAGAGAPTVTAAPEPLSTGQPSAKEDNAPPPTPTDSAGASDPVASGGGGAASAVRGMSAALYVEAVEAMLAALGDYQTDNRGDVGSWVREAAVGSLLPMLLLGSPAEVGDAAGDEATVLERASLAAAMPGLCGRFVEVRGQQPPWKAPAALPCGTCPRPLQAPCCSVTH